MQELSGPPAGRRQREVPAIRRAGAWLVWWVLLMSLWVIVDDSIALDELLAGAGAAALAAFLAELVTHQAGTPFRMRVEWLVPALGLPGQVVRDTVIVFAALWRRLLRGEQPPSGFPEIPACSGGTSDENVTRRINTTCRGSIFGRRQGGNSAPLTDLAATRAI
jgi:hypothetical protein